MTDKESLFTYRLKQAEETLSDAKRMLQDKLSPRSIVNRAYYSMFYAVLAPEDFLEGIKRHLNVIK
ncbi:MAG: hypothetical protein HY805_08810 [Nitrospirae bacterium]|nr:hypothetical protein [Nitrospirota bacterium]